MQNARVNNVGLEKETAARAGLIPVKWADKNLFPI